MPAGMISKELGGPSGKERALSTSVERIDALNQEITLKGPDGGLETTMVSESRIPQPCQDLAIES